MATQVSGGSVKLTDAQLATLQKNNPTLYKKITGEISSDNVLQVSGGSIASNIKTTQFINSNQDSDIASANEAPTRGGTIAEKYSTALTELGDLFKPEGGTPAAPSYESTFNSLRDSYNVDTLEQTLNDIQSEEDALLTDLRSRRAAERDKPVATNVIEGRIGQEERQTMERLDYLTQQKNAAVRALTAANATIENVMNLKKLDYETARQTYNDQFSQQLQLFNTIKGVVDEETAAENRAADNARANLNIIYGAIADGGIDKASLDPAMAYTVSTLELQAGLPTGFYNNIASSNPGGKILSTTTRTSGGAKYADVLFQNKDGSLSTKQVYLGADSTGSGSGKDYSEADLERENRSIIAGVLNPVRGQDGYVAPKDYVSARDKAISSGAYDRESFDKEFARQYVNPNDRDAAGVQYIFDLLENFGV